MRFDIFDGVKIVKLVNKDMADLIVFIGLLCVVLFPPVANWFTRQLLQHAQSEVSAIANPAIAAIERQQAETLRQLSTSHPPQH